MSDLSRPVALVTGATRAGRVGLATALALARAGCDLILTYRSGGDEARAASQAVEKAGGSARVEQVDLADTEAAEAWAGKLARSLGRLDVLVHNASIYRPTPTDTVKAAEVEESFRVNALSPLLLSRALAPLLGRSGLPGGGAIVAMCDIHAMGVAGQARRNFMAYSMSKAALLEMVVVLARELAPRIRVNGVAPGVVAFPTDGHEADPQAQARYLSRVPLARSGTPEDAAEAVRWLALDARYTTGHVVRVDGGRSIT